MKNTNEVKLRMNGTATKQTKLTDFFPEIVEKEAKSSGDRDSGK